MPRLVHLIRHGQSTFNEHYSATGEDPLHFDARLTRLGERQVAGARERLAAYDYDIVIASPLTRAIQTAEGIFGGRVRIEISALHREWQVSSCDIGRSLAELRSDFPHLDFSALADPWWHHAAEPCELGFPQETEAHLAERLAAFKAMIDARPERRIAVVGHGDFFSRLIGRHLDNCEMAEWLPAIEIRRA
ncbi:MAG TPA: histidine phosphatase family protein [Dongiaceae bacterium]|nr:histidine phosphatase family protein [Dongiaceae bacterium]